MRKIVAFYVALNLASFASGQSRRELERPIRQAVRGVHGAIVAGSEYATEAGMREYYKGGNAVDVGVSAMFAASVTELSHFGLGGEAPILIRTKAGNGDLTLSGTNSFAGTLNITGGYVTAASNSALGFGTVTLQSSSVSQTAELDVAVVLNSSFSEALDTYYAQNAKNGGGTNIYPSSCYNTVVTGDVATTGQEECNNSFALMNFQDFTNRQPNSVSEAQGGLAGTWGVGPQDGPRSLRDLPRGLESGHAISIGRRAARVKAPPGAGTRQAPNWLGPAIMPPSTTNSAPLQ